MAPLLVVGVCQLAAKLALQQGWPVVEKWLVLQQRVNQVNVLDNTRRKLTVVEDADQQPDTNSCRRLGGLVTLSMMVREPMATYMRIWYQQPSPRLTTADKQ